MGKDPLTVRMHVSVRGHVQGVGFRWFVRESADRLGVHGWVRNLPDGAVELEAQGTRNVLGQFISEVKTGHPYARVVALETREIPVSVGNAFEIR